DASVSPVEFAPSDLWARHVTGRSLHRSAHRIGLDGRLYAAGRVHSCFRLRLDLNGDRHAVALRTWGHRPTTWSTHRFDPVVRRSLDRAAAGRDRAHVTPCAFSRGVGIDESEYCRWFRSRAA